MCDLLTSTASLNAMMPEGEETRFVAILMGCAMMLRGNDCGLVVSTIVAILMVCAMMLRGNESRLVVSTSVVILCIRQCCSMMNIVQ